MVRFLSLLAMAVTVLTDAADNVQVSAIELSHDPNDVHFYLFPDKNDINSFDEIQFNQSSSVQTSRIRSGAKTVFIIHGFRSNVSSDMPQTLKKAFLANVPEYNVIVVSWGALATPLPPELTASFYSFVLPNVPIVADRVASFLLFLKDNYIINLKDIYLIGHSLGSHVSGLTGKYVFKRTGQKLPRITGLDPAGPLYFPPSPERNIMPDNAQYVDIIHTNMGILGDTTRDGHADFYPNGGIMQPDCTAGDYASPETIGRCSHWFAYRLFAASMSVDKQFNACPCEPFLLSYSLGLCTTICTNPAKVGFRSDPSTRGEFYLKTTNPP